jgi:purine-cytosine permease-like protein
VAIAGSVLLVISLWVPWFRTDPSNPNSKIDAFVGKVNAWDAFQTLPPLLILTALMPLLLAYIVMRDYEVEWARGEITTIVGAIAFLLALAFTMERYEVFLFLIGSVFVPLAAIFLADYFVRSGGRYGGDVVFGSAADGVRWRALIPWAVGFVLYHWSVPTGPQGWVDAVAAVFTGLGLPFPLLDSRLGASLPSFALTFVLALVVLPRRRAPIG